jgi:hypothetical protein
LRRLDDPLSCYQRANVEWADVGDAVTFHGEPGQEEENDAQTPLVDLDPRRLCSADSGRPIYDGSGNAVGLVSRSGGEARVRAQRMPRSCR